MAAKGSAGGAGAPRQVATVQVNVRMDPGLADRLRRGAAARGRNVQEVVAQLVDEWLAREGL